MHLDTHALLWLLGGELHRFSQSIHQRLKTEELVASPMAEMELQYLFELGRIRRPGNEVVRALSTQIGLRISEAPFNAVIAEASRLSWTRDPFDRIIVANALADAAVLLTKDELIRKHCPSAIWD